jgi:hypothetical protein
MVWHTIFSIWIICAAFPFTCSLSFSSCIILLQGSHHHKTTKQNKFWTWKCHISTANRTSESTDVSLGNPSTLALCCEIKLPIELALETLKVQTMATWQRNQTKQIVNLKMPHLHG